MAFKIGGQTPICSKIHQICREKREAVTIHSPCPFPDNVPAPSLRLPILFVGHGSPMNAIMQTPFKDEWQRIGGYFGPGKRWPEPQLILCISAHWCTEGTALTAMAVPKTIHDFGGFPQALFEQQYAVPGDPAMAHSLSLRFNQASRPSPLMLDEAHWGLDHGTWSFLKPMFPKGDIPVIQLSLDVHATLEQHMTLGAQLNALRDEGVLVVASGNTVHNLGAMQRHVPDSESYDWAAEFDQWVAHKMVQRDASALCMQGADEHTLKLFRLAHPSIDHYLPLLYAFAASQEEDRMSFFNDQYQYASVSMRSALWDAPARV